MPWSDLFARGFNRHGVVCLGDAVAAGVSKRAVARRAAREEWEVLHPGVWLLPGIAYTSLAGVAGAVLATEGGAAAGRTGLWLHDLDRRVPTVPEVVVPYGMRGPVRGRRVRVARTRAMPEEHVVRARAIPTLTVERLVLHLARTWSLPRLRGLVIDAMHEDSLDVAALAAMRQAYGRGRAGMRTLDAILADPSVGRSGSGWEVEVRDEVAALGVDVHPGPFPYRCADGVVVEIDVALPCHWVALECDGRAFHSAPRPFATDRVRWTQLVRDWRTVWVTWARWRDDRAGVLGDVLDAVRAADLSRPRALPAR